MMVSAFPYFFPLKQKIIWKNHLNFGNLLFFIFNRVFLRSESHWSCNTSMVTLWSINLKCAHKSYWLYSTVTKVKLVHPTGDRRPAICSTVEWALSISAPSSRHLPLAIGDLYIFPVFDMVKGWILLLNHCHSACMSVSVSNVHSERSSTWFLEYSTQFWPTPTETEFISAIEFHFSRSLSLLSLTRVIVDCHLSALRAHKSQYANGDN